MHSYDGIIFVHSSYAIRDRMHLLGIPCTIAHRDILDVKAFVLEVFYYSLVEIVVLCCHNNVSGLLGIHMLQKWFVRGFDGNWHFGASDLQH